MTVLKKTDKFRVVMNNPWISSGEIIDQVTPLVWFKFSEQGEIDSTHFPSNFEIDRYPHIFAPLYEAEDGTLLAEGDTVYRIVTKGYDEVVKPIKLNFVHIEGEVPFFTTKERAEKELKKRGKKMKEKFTNEDIIDNIYTISAMVSCLNMDEVPLSETRRVINNIKGLADHTIKLIKL